MNNNFYNPYLPYQQSYQQYPYQQNNPYADRINNIQQYQQQLQTQNQSQSSLCGKVVDSIDVVKATDIPMDGNLYYFPKADGTELYAKHWLANGTTEIVIYKPYSPISDENNQQAVNSSNDNLKLIYEENNALRNDFNESINSLTEKLDGIFDRIDNLEQSLKKTTTKTTRTKRGTTAE